jgi:tripeptide aminopeptidase
MSIMPSRSSVASTHAALTAARHRLQAIDDAIVREQVDVAEVPAPTGDEGARAAWMLRRFSALGLQSVRRDQAGNVIGRRAGIRDAAPVVVCAHLDTVFPHGTNLTVRQEGNRLAGPGITDNGRGLAVLLALAGAIDGQAIALDRPVDFVASTGEEGAGDLRGVKHFFAHAPRRPAAMVALDGAGDHRIIHRALGSRRYRVSFNGPGGHSWAAFGAPNAVHAAAGAVARLAAIPLSSSPRTTLTVGRIGGGISVNSIPDYAWLEIDVRSVADSALERMEREVREAIAAAAREENARRADHAPALTHEVTRIGQRPGGETPAEHPLVAAAAEATRLVGRLPELSIASTDANAPIGLGIPAIAIGAGGRGGDAHAITEWFENAHGTVGVARALTIVVTATQLCAD